MPQTLELEAIGVAAKTCDVRDGAHAWRTAGDPLAGAPRSLAQARYDTSVFDLRVNTGYPRAHALRAISLSW
jgi:hypothetical protein